MPRGREKRSPSSPGLGVGIGATTPASGENPNLLLWTEALDNAAWSQSAVTVQANASVDPLGGATAERVVMLTVTSFLKQVSGGSGTGGPVSGFVPLTGAWVRRSVSGDFDGVSWTFSVHLLDNGSGVDVQLVIEASGEALVAGLVDDGNGVADFYAWGAQLEQSATATAYQKREGT